MYTTKYGLMMSTAIQIINQFSYILSTLSFRIAVQGLEVFIHMQRRITLNTTLPILKLSPLIIKVSITEK